MGNRDYKAFVVEGKEREPEIIDNISKNFFKHHNFEIITLPAEQNIYMLWKKLKEDDFETDLIEVLRESHEKIKQQLEGFTRDEFSEIFLFFDYDAHQNNLSKWHENEKDASNVIEQMLENFNNETENGKLYISYPMAEALRDYKAGTCGDGESCFISIDDLSNYKNLSAERSVNHHIRDYAYEDWKDIIEMFVKRASCLFGKNEIFSFEEYREKVDPSMIHSLEQQEIGKKGIFIISAFPEFILDYFDNNTFNTFLKDTKKQLKKNTACKRE